MIYGLFRMRSFRGNLIKAIGYILLGLRMVDDESLFNTLLIVRAWEEKLRVVEV